MKFIAIMTTSSVSILLGILCYLFISRESTEKEIADVFHNVTEQIIAIKGNLLPNAYKHPTGIIPKQGCHFFNFFSSLI